MKTIVRWAVRLFLVLLILGISLGAYIYWCFGQSLPQTDGEMELAGLHTQTSIVRDVHGIAHIFANSDHDMFFALGVAHAQDRMFQMDLSRRAAHGTLSELVGKLTLANDIKMRTLGLGAAADRSFAILNPKTRAAFQAYADGVNAVLSADGYVAPPEYILLMNTPAPWRAEDCGAVLKMMAYGLSGNAFEEPKYKRLQEILGKERAAEFLAPYPANAPITLNEADLGIEEAPQSAPATQTRPTTFSTPSGEPPQGSNNWVVDGQLTASGKPLLANDPHLALGAPGVWYFARMQHGDTMMLGATIPGTPFVTLGRNHTAAWGFTNTGPDTADLFVVPTTELGATTEETRIKVRWGKEQMVQILRTKQGPVLNPDYFPAANIAQKGQSVILQSTLDDDDDTTGELGIALIGAKTFADFYEGLQSYIMPQQNMVFADTQDTIGFVAPARIPVRDADGKWIGEIPYEELPTATNPDRHYFASANNKIVPDSYPHFLTNSWYGFHRARRIVELIEDTQLHDATSFAHMQMDTVSDLARRATALIAASAPNSAGGEEVRQILSGWDGNLSADRAEGLLYSSWMRHFTRNLYQDDLGADFEQFWIERREFVEGVLDGRYANWCDNIQTNDLENCRTIAALALDQTYQEFAPKGKQVLSELRWGDIHQANFAHPLLDATPLGRFFSVHVPVGGDSSTLNVAHSSYVSGNYEVNWAASMRAIYDFSDLNSSLFMHGPGQSGHVLSPHYRDLAKKWAKGEYFEIRADWDPTSPPPDSQTLLLKPKK